MELEESSHEVPPSRRVGQSSLAPGPPVVDSAPFGLPAGTKNDQENATLGLVRGVALDDRSSGLGVDRVSRRRNAASIDPVS